MSTELTSDDRAALRGFLQRQEVRLSTFHRTATALLSGAGVLVLLPALGRDAVVNVISRLFGSERTAPDLLITAGVGLVMASIIIVIWMLLVELTRFFFYANHLGRDGGSTFTTRFALTSLRLPTDELTPAGRVELDAARQRPETIEQLFCANQRTRQYIDAKASAYPGLDEPTDDVSRARILATLAGARDRDLLEEVAKTEYTSVRHALRIQVIVLRYMKALLTVILSLLLMFGLTAAMDSAGGLDQNARRWAVLMLMVWAAAVLFASSGPIRWITTLLRNEGADRSGIRYDSELVRLERVMSVITSAVIVSGAVAGFVLVARGDMSAVDVWFGVAVAGLVLAHLALLATTRRA